ncbi:MAG: helix-turn-helix domain-containing protein [Erysipelotrichaceae bacterium]|nr:helix-turn-helix domain-containing protein [Erysipelotrichaceae bacterium]
MFCDVLKKLRNEKGYSQKELAEATGMSVHTINSYESGRRQPTMKNLQILQDYFNVSKEYLMDNIDSNVYLENTEDTYLNYKTVTTELEKIMTSTDLTGSEQNKIASVFMLESLTFIEECILSHNNSYINEDDIIALFDSLLKYNEKGLKEAIKRINELSMIDTYTSK